jgi:hypothetical protein
LIFEPALLIQRLGAINTNELFSGRFWGLAGAWHAPSVSLELNLASNERVAAVQARAYGRSGNRRWWLEYWLIPGAFRNPLLHARGESDRELVYYPELDASFSSASTGERGGRLDVRFGGTLSYVRLHMVAWREETYRQASVRVRATLRQTLTNTAVQTDYLLYSRISDGSRRHRHVGQVKVSRKYVSLSGRVRITDGETSTFGPLSGQLAGSIGFPLSHVGAWSLTLAADSYDLSTQAKQFVTIRVAQQLPFRYGRMDVHLRWRSTYASGPSALSLRVDSRVYL